MHNRFRLTDLEKADIRAALEDIYYDPLGGSDYICTLRMTAYREFPDRVLQKLESLKGDDASYCVFENIPVDDVFGSPQHNTDSLAHKRGYVSENVLVALGSMIAEPYSIRHEGPKLVNDLVPHLEAIGEYTGNGSDLELDLHTENAYQAYDTRGDTSPLALMLLGVRSDPEGNGPMTWVSDAREAINAMCPTQVEWLYGKHYMIRQPYRWRTENVDPSESRLCPILSGPSTHPRVTAAFYPDMVIATGEEAKEAYGHFYEALKKSAKPVDIQPGTLIYINNRFVLHSRDRFTPTYDVKGYAYRWVQRVFLTNNLWNFRSFKKSGARIFDPVTRAV